MKQFYRSFTWKLGLLIVTIAVFLVAVGFVAKISYYHTPVSTQAPVSDSESDASSTRPPVDWSASTREPAGFVSSEEVRLNCFLTSIVQQNIENTKTDLDEDAELIRFAFGYRKTNDAASILEQEENGVSCRTLTLEQVNETLCSLFDITISPDREDYGIPDDDFHCVFRDGCFWNVPPYPVERVSFPLRFALVEKIDEKTCTLHFRLYTLNPDAWEEGEAERHVPLMPMTSILDAETRREGSKDWITRIGEGDAILRDFGEELQLVEMKATLYH